MAQINTYYLNHLMSKIYLEVFDSVRKKVFQSLKAFSDIGYLAGGTALTLQLKHRISYDFDVFMPHAVNNTLRQQISALFPKATYSLNTSDQINLRTKENINVSFIWYYFPLLSPLIQTDSLPLATISDIAADKVQTIGRRAIWRDYVDIYWLLKSGILNLTTIIQLAQKKFKGEFNSFLFLEQLVYFDDVAIVPIEFYSSPPQDTEIKTFLKTEVANFTAQNILNK